MHTIQDVLRASKKIPLAAIQAAFATAAETGAAYDPKAGVQLVEMTEPALPKFYLLAGNGGAQELRPYAVRVAGGERVRGHWHVHGPEIYGMPSDAEPGDFRMYTGAFNSAGKTTVIWNKKPGQFVPGQSFAIPEGTPHSLVNAGGNPLFFVVYCDPTHVGKGAGAVKEDRVFAANAVEA